MSKIFTKNKVIMGLMLTALGAAVVLNMRYSGQTKYLGEATYVSENVNSEEVVETSASVENDYLLTQRENRETAYEEALSLINETLKDADVSQEQREEALKKAEQLAENKTNEASIEALLSAKSFKNPLVILGEDSATVIVNSAELSAGETLQIKDAVCSVKQFESSNIKIVAVNS